jgi:ABC-type nitrate/sulfonate/bicarbonate transport system substrate-binding protein
VARKEVIEKSPELLKQFLAGTREASAAFVKDPNNLQMISKTSKLSIDDSKKWLQEVKFSETNKVSKKMLGEAVSILVKNGILKESVDSSTLYDAHVANVTE